MKEFEKVLWTGGNSKKLPIAIIQERVKLAKELKRLKYV